MTGSSATARASAQNEEPSTTSTTSNWSDWSEQFQILGRSWLRKVRTWTPRSAEIGQFVSASQVSSVVHGQVGPRDFASERTYGSFDGYIDQHFDKLNGKGELEGTQRGSQSDGHADGESVDRESPFTSWFIINPLELHIYLP